MALQPKDTLRNRYQIVGLIGVGGMGAVYLADDLRLKGRQCAVKETHFAPNLNPEIKETAREQFYQEASTLAQLDHPGLPKVSDYFSVDDQDYLVMDFVPGQNLQEVVQQAQRSDQFLDEMTVLAWVDQICDTLIYLHERQPPVLHRDIKPANIKLTPDNRIKLVDFGLAKPLDPTDPSTLTGFQGMGSLPYAPLEQYLDHLGHTSARSDLYALGATVYHLLTNRTPTSAQERFLDPSALPKIEAINPTITSAVSQTILEAMAPHPKERPESIAMWQQKLKQARETRPLDKVNQVNQADPATPTEVTAQTLFHDNRWLIGVVFILLIISVWLTFGS